MMKELNPLCSAPNIAAFILENSGSTNTQKLHMLVYYAQAWVLVFNKKLLFSEEIQARQHGPMIPELEKMHPSTFVLPRRYFKDYLIDLEPDVSATINKVLERYGDMVCGHLGARIRSEAPWQEARATMQSCEDEAPAIMIKNIKDYYSLRAGWA